MRAALPLLLAVAVACGDGRTTAGSDGLRVPAGPDPVVVRLPLAGGTARAYKFTALDTVIWRSSHHAPAVDRVLAFDQENGLLAFVDTTGYPGWVDLRLGSVRRPTRGSFVSVASADGWAVYGLSNGGSLVRMTPSGDWQSPLDHPVRRVLPTPDGGVLLVSEAPTGDGQVLRMRPPEEALLDSMAIVPVERAAVTAVGDRAYLSAGARIWSVAPNEFAGARSFEAGDKVLALAPTPSGDRVFIANEGGSRLDLLDRYEGAIRRSVKLPGLATELRMDPLGRYLLVRPVAGDSAWIVNVGEEALVATVPTRWRPDLPVVALDGSIATWRGRDVVFVDPADPTSMRRVAGGAADLWFFARWNGFRPRARGIDQPVAFRTGSDSARADAPASPGPPTAPVATERAAAATSEPPAAPPPPEPPRGRGGWLLSFAAVLSLERAQAVAAQVNLEGQRPRIITSEADGTTVYRVVLGPYPSREDAERAGRASGHSFWVYEGGT